MVSKLERNGFAWLMLIPGRSSSLREVRAELKQDPTDRNRRRDHRGVLLAGLLLGWLPAPFLMYVRPT